MLACAIVPPVPVPYREPLFQRLARRPELAIRVIYQAASQPSWDQAAGWFPADHGYDAEHLRPLHIARRGRSPITWPRGLEGALSRFDPDVVVVSEFGPATLRALAWCRARRRALVVLSEVTIAAQRTLGMPQRRLHRLLAAPLPEIDVGIVEILEEFGEEGITVGGDRLLNTLKYAGVHSFGIVGGLEQEGRHA